MEAVSADPRKHGRRKSSGASVALQIANKFAVMPQMISSLLSTKRDNVEDVTHSFKRTVLLSKRDASSIQSGEEDGDPQNEEKHKTRKPTKRNLKQPPQPFEPVGVLPINPLKNIQPSTWTPVEVVISTPLQSVPVGIVSKEMDFNKWASDPVTIQNEDVSRRPGNKAVEIPVLQGQNISGFVTPLLESDSEDDAISSPVISSRFAIANDVLKKSAKQPVKRQKATTSLKCSPFLAEILNSSSRSPFDRPVLGSLGPRELTFCLEDAYCPGTETLKALTTKFTSKDIIVCSPMRTGQTPILRALCMLASGHSTSIADDDKFVMDHVKFLGSTLVGTPPQSFGQGTRVFKTHMNLRCFLRKEVTSMSMEKKPKIIIPIRDPLRVLESWYRHLKHVYEHMEGTSFPFGQAEFVNYCPSSFHPAYHQEGEHYEKFISQALSLAQFPNVCLIFYEDLITDGEKVIAQIAKFTGLAPGNPSLVKRVARAIADNAEIQEFKLEPVFSEDFIKSREGRWADHVEYSRTSMRAKNYYEMYEKITNRPYPVERFQSSPTIATTKPRVSELKFFRRN